MGLFDREMIEKYVRPGPRYTSYPTAPHLVEGFGDSEFASALEKSRTVGRPLSIYVHIPFCRSLCLFCACNMVVTRRRDRIDAYIDYLEKDIQRTAEMVDGSRKVTQLHWGGGTPSYLDPEQIRLLTKLLRDNFDFDDDAEISVEIDPRNVGEEHVAAFTESGFNRISVGVQDVDEKVQKTINRVQPYEQTAQVIDWARARGVESVNIDLMYGLPFQTPAGFRHTLDTCLELNPQRIALFNYAHVPWMKKHQEALNLEDMPSSDERLTILGESIQRLIDQGYQFIGMDHFALPDDDLAVARREGTLWRNFQGYTTRGGVDLLGFGTTALGLFEDAYYQKSKGLKEYYAAIDEGGLGVVRGVSLSDEDRLRREIIMSLMCHFALDVPAIEAKWNVDFWDKCGAVRDSLSGFEQDELLSISDERIEVNERGRLLIRNIAMSFDAYLAERTQNFSKTV